MAREPVPASTRAASILVAVFVAGTALLLGGVAAEVKRSLSDLGAELPLATAAVLWLPRWGYAMTGAMVGAAVVGKDWMLARNDMRALANVVACVLAFAAFELAQSALLLPFFVISQQVR